MMRIRVLHPVTYLGIARTAAPLLALAVGACGDEPTGPTAADEAEIVEVVESGVTMGESDQLLLNGDMEAGGTSPEVWWNGGTSDPNFNFEWSDVESVSSARSLSIGDAAGATTSFAFWAQSLDVVNPAGMTFQLNVSIKLEAVQGEGISIAIRGDDTSLGNGRAEVFATTQGRELIAGTEEWSTHTVELSNVPSQVDRITVYFVYLPNNTGTAYFDDATLSVSRTVPTVELQNTDIEQGGLIPDAWWSGGTGYESFSFLWSAAQSASGTRSLAIHRDTPHPEEFGYWGQTIDAANFVGRSAILSVEVLASGLQGQGASIAIRADDTPGPEGYAESFATTQGSQSIVGGGGWQTYTVTLGSVPANALSVTVYVIYLPETYGTVYFDNVSLVPG